MAKTLLDSIEEDDIRKLFDKLDDLELAKHYDFNSIVNSSIRNEDDVVKFLKTNVPLKFSFNESNILYYEIPGELEPTIFDVDIDKSFVKSDSWLYDKLVTVTSVFPNAVSVDLSNEMASFYICLVIASVFDGAFKDELIEVSSTYSFEKWQPTTEESTSMLELQTSWVQIGSRYVKMVAAAAKYALLREKQKKRVPSALQLPQEVVLELNKTINDVSAIRFNYDEIKLSPINRSALSKLEIKVIIAERDKEIQRRIEKDPKIYQIWRLLNLNSNMIPPTILLKINREARQSAIEHFKRITNSDSLPKTRDEKLEVKQVEDKFKREVRRAYLNKLFSNESRKFVSNPDVYVAPDFV